MPASHPLVDADAPTDIGRTFYSDATCSAKLVSVAATEPLPVYVATMTATGGRTLAEVGANYQGPTYIRFNGNCQTHAPLGRTYYSVGAPIDANEFVLAVVERDP